MNKYKLVSIHIVCWAFFIILSVFDYIQKSRIDVSELQLAIVKQSTFYLIYVVLFYFNAYCLYPKFFNKKKFGLYIFTLLLLWIGCYILFIFHGYFLFIISGKYEFFF